VVPHPVVPASESEDGNLLCPCQLMIAVVLVMVWVVLLPCLLVCCFDGTLGFLAFSVKHAPPDHERRTNIFLCVDDERIYEDGNGLFGTPKTTIGIRDTGKNRRENRDRSSAGKRYFTKIINGIRVLPLNIFIGMAENASQTTPCKLLCVVFCGPIM
jgi:hypothetical protein